MNWISNLVRPKIRNFLRRETPENLWIKCPETGQLVFYKDVESNQFVIPSSNYHMRVSAVNRLKTMFDGGAYEDIAVPEVPLDPLKFRDERRYADRLKDARIKTGMQDAVKLGKRSAQVGQVVQDGVAEHEVKAPVRERQRLGVSPGGPHREPQTPGVGGQRGDHPR